MQYGMFLAGMFKMESFCNILGEQATIWKLCEILICIIFFMRTNLCFSIAHFFVSLCF